MNQRTNLAAYTPAERTPAFISINLEEDGRVSVAVRSTGDSDGTGTQGCIYLTQETAAGIFAEAAHALARVALNEPKAREPQPGECDCIAAVSDVPHATDCPASK